MFTILQIVDRPPERVLERVLECVWSLSHSDDKLICVWVERFLQTEAGECAPEEELDLNQRVA